jgi:phosphoribosylaminoimidazole-succinocarboxamide synthase
MSYGIEGTNFHLPGQVGERYSGKVGDTYTIDHESGELLVVVRTDRISAFDVVLPALIPSKGQVLTGMSAELLEATRATAPNWLIGSPDPNVSVGYKANPFKLEMIVRGALLGSSWKAYKEEDIRTIGDVRLPGGMREFELFHSPIITPTTKADVGHDENITPSAIVEQGLATRNEYDHMAHLALSLFRTGQAMATQRGLFLADTKYEFGKLPNGQIVVIDEVHTPDSSRYFPWDEYDTYISTLRGADRPEQLSKEFVREWLKAQGFTGEPGQELPTLPLEFIAEVSVRYQELYERMLNKTFHRSPMTNTTLRLEAMEDAIVEYIENIDQHIK